MRMLSRWQMFEFLSGMGGRTFPLRWCNFSGVTGLALIVMIVSDVGYGK